MKLENKLRLLNALVRTKHQFRKIQRFCNESFRESNAPVAPHTICRIISDHLFCTEVGELDRLIWTIRKSDQVEATDLDGRAWIDEPDDELSAAEAVSAKWNELAVSLLGYLALGVDELVVEFEDVEQKFDELFDALWYSIHSLRIQARVLSSLLTAAFDYLNSNVDELDSEQQLQRIKTWQVRIMEEYEVAELSFDISDGCEGYADDQEMYERDKAIYEQVNAGMTNPQVIEWLNKQASGRWQPIVSPQGIRDCVTRYCLATKSPIPRRSGGRPKKMPNRRLESIKPHSETAD